MGFGRLALAAGLAMLATEASPQALFEDVSATHLPPKPSGGTNTMTARAVDVDGDGDLDLVLAVEYTVNRLLMNDGSGVFTDQSDTRLPRVPGDYEDIAVADLDGDNDLDLVFAGEDDQVFAYYLNDGCGVFSDVTDRLPRRGVSNTVITFDVDGDDDADLVFANNGQDFLFINDGTGSFSDETETRLPASDDVTQAMAAGDIDGDGDLDIVVGNEGGHKLLLNDGAGYFADVTTDRLPQSGVRETRDVHLIDVDGDGDLDIHFSNLILFVGGANPQDQLMLNDGQGRFTDVTATHLPEERGVTMASSFIDFDGDGDLDIVSSDFNVEQVGGFRPYVALRNDGTGRFEVANDVLPEGTVGHGFTIEVADFNRDGRMDLFLGSRDANIPPVDGRQHQDLMLFGLPIGESAPAPRPIEPCLP